MSRALAFPKREPVDDLGPLLSLRQAQAKFPGDDRPSLDWCRRNITPRVELARKVYFYERDVDRFILSRRKQSA